MTRCCVPNCEETGGHRFPKDASVRKLWLKAIRRENLIPTDGTRICRKHFTDDDYTKMSNYTGLKHQHNYLHKFAVPSIFPWSKSRPVTEKRLAHRIGRKTKNSSREVTPNSEENKRTGPVCSVPQCNSSSVLKGISFHHFPKNYSLKKKWSQILDIDKEITKEMIVCSLHFDKNDFVSEGDSSENMLLKRNAIPSQGKCGFLPPAKNLKKIETISDSTESTNLRKKSGTMSDAGEENVGFVSDGVPDCRACLRKCEEGNSFCNIFQAWSPPWIGMGATIAEDLAKVANIEVPVTDVYPISICEPCYQNLLNAAKFAAKVRYSDTLLKLKQKEYQEDNWPKPIQIDKNVNGLVYENAMEVDIKQEVLSDEEYQDKSSTYMDSNFGNVDIKLEPEEMVEPPPMQITINGTMSLDPSSNPVMNGIVADGEQHLEVVMKQEPLSDDEDSELTLDLPLECMLCAKIFNSVSGLKAHVIAQHSYKTVKRKTGNKPSPEKKPTERHVCAICRRSFATSTDLMVHETCHNKYSCYGCNAKFDTFELLSKHRLRCKVKVGAEVVKPKTLDDVMRSQLGSSKENSPTPDLNTNPLVAVEHEASQESIVDMNQDVARDLDTKPDDNVIINKDLKRDRSVGKVDGNDSNLNESELSDKNLKLDDLNVSNMEEEDGNGSFIRQNDPNNSFMKENAESDSFIKQNDNSDSFIKQNDGSDSNMSKSNVSDSHIQKNGTNNSHSAASQGDANDSNMKLLLEIHSANNEAESIGLNNGDIEMEHLCRDDK